MRGNAKQSDGPYAQHLVHMPVKLLHNLYQVTVFGCPSYPLGAFWKTTLPPTNGLRHPAACRRGEPRFLGGRWCLALSSTPLSGFNCRVVRLRLRWFSSVVFPAFHLARSFAIPVHVVRCVPFVCPVVGLWGLHWYLLMPGMTEIDGEYFSAPGAPGKLSPYFPQFPPFSAFFVPVSGARCCLKTDILMLLSHWGYGIFGFSPVFTHFLLISTTSIPLFRLILIYPHYGDPEKAGVM